MDTALYTIADLSTVWVIADVFDAEHVDQEIGQFMGAAGELFSPAVPDQVFVK